MLGFCFYSICLEEANYIGALPILTSKKHTDLGGGLFPEVSSEIYIKRPLTSFCN